MKQAQTDAKLRSAAKTAQAKVEQAKLEAAKATEEANKKNAEQASKMKDLQQAEKEAADGQKAQ